EDAFGGGVGIGVGAEGDEDVGGGVEDNDGDEVGAGEALDGLGGGLVGDLLLGVFGAEDGAAHGAGVVEDEDDGGVGLDEALGEVEAHGEEGLDDAALPA